MELLIGIFGLSLLMAYFPVMADRSIQLVNNCARDITVYSKDGTNPLISYPVLTPRGTSLQTVRYGFQGAFYARYRDTAAAINGLSGSKKPDTVIGFRLDESYLGDSYYLDVINGYTVPAKVEGIAGTFFTHKDQPNNCRQLSCNVDLASACPEQFQVKVANQVVACQSACEKNGSCPAPYDGYSRPVAPSDYAVFFWKNCPDARSYVNKADFSVRCSPKPAQVDSNGYGVYGTTYTVTIYKITFC